MQISLSCIIIIDSSLRPTPPEVYNILRDKRSRWEQLGSELCIPLSFRQELHRNHTVSTDRCLRMVVDRWLQQTENPTWDQLIEALTEMQLYDSVQRIKKFLEKGQYMIHSCI